MRKIFLCIIAVFVTAWLGGCSPEVGSIEWCEKMDKKPKGEWSTNDVKSYAENCVFRKSDD